MNAPAFRPADFGPVIPGYHISVDASGFANLILDAVRELTRTGRRLDFENLAQYMGVEASILRRVVMIEVLP